MSILADIVDFLGFSGTSSKSISFYKLYTQMNKWKNQKTFPYDYELPDQIYFDEKFWKKLIELYKATLRDNHERAITVFYLDGDIILSSVTRGLTSSVKPQGKVQVKYTPTTKREYFNKEIYVDDELYSKREIYYKKINSKLDLKYLFNMHTHPAHNYEGKNYYSFFSLQDIKSLIASESVITGLITDKLWLIVRTAQTPHELSNFQESEISIKSLEEKLHIAVYCGDFWEKMERVIKKYE